MTLGIRYPLSAGAWLVGLNAAVAVPVGYWRRGVVDSEALLVAIGGIAVGAFVWPGKNDRDRYRSEHEVSRREAWWLIPTATAIVSALLIAFGVLAFILMMANRGMSDDIQILEERVAESEERIRGLEEDKASLFTTACLALTNGNIAECERAWAEYERTR